MLTAIFAFLLKLLSGGMLDKVLGHLERKADTETERERIRTGVTIEQIRAEVAAQQEARAIIISEQGRWYTAIVRPLFAVPFIIYIWKLVLWDKVLSMGSTDGLSPELWNVLMTIIGAFFIGRSAEKVASTLSSRK